MTHRYPRRFKPKGTNAQFATVECPGGPLMATDWYGFVHQWGGRCTEADAEAWLTNTDYWKDCETFDHHPAPEQPTHPEITAAVEAAGTFSQPDGVVEQRLTIQHDSHITDLRLFHEFATRLGCPDGGVTMRLIWIERRWKELGDAERESQHRKECVDDLKVLVEGTRKDAECDAYVRAKVADWIANCDFAIKEGWPTDGEQIMALAAENDELRTENQRLAGEVDSWRETANRARQDYANENIELRKAVMHADDLTAQLTAATDRVGRLEECLRKITTIREEHVPIVGRLDWCIRAADAALSAGAG